MSTGSTGYMFGDTGCYHSSTAHPSGNPIYKQ
jgi:hypothetical protein